MLTVKTANGEIKGLYDEKKKLYKFLGIPYAESPTEKNRFKPPVPKQSWEGVLEATQFGPCSAQEWDDVEGPKEDFGGDFFNEDSLVLNIWTPGVDDKKRPVMIWIHGGANMVGTSRSPFYDGSNLASFGETVIVSIQYRLNVFGFLDVSIIGGDEYAGSCNNGLLDQACAIKWIKDNIMIFGGDPCNITLFGESAGGMNQACLLSMFPEGSLFQKVIMQSGCAGSFKTRKKSEKYAREFFKNTGIDSIKQLIDTDTKELIVKAAKWIATYGVMFSDEIFLPTIDGKVICEHPLHTIKSGKCSAISMMIGWTNNELRYWYEYSKMLAFMPSFVVKKKLKHEHPEVNCRKIINEYKKHYRHFSFGERSMQILGDYFFAYPALLDSEYASRAGQKVWVYRVDWSVPGDKRGAFHSIENGFVFRNHGMSYWNERFKFKKVSESRRDDLMNVMSRAWLSFAEVGDPNTFSDDKMPEWENFDNEKRQIMLFNNKSELVENIEEWKWNLFDKITFDGEKNDD